MWNTKPSEKQSLFTVLLLCLLEFVRGKLWGHESVPLESKDLAPVDMTIKTFLYFFSKPFEGLVKPGPGIYMHICADMCMCIKFWFLSKNSFFFGSILWRQMVALRQFIYETDGKDVIFFLLKQNLKQNFSKKLRYKSSALIAFCLCTQM